MMSGRAFDWPAAARELTFEVLPTAAYRHG